MAQLVEPTPVAAVVDESTTEALRDRAHYVQEPRNEYGRGEIHHRVLRIVRIVRTRVGQGLLLIVKHKVGALLVGVLALLVAHLAACAPCMEVEVCTAVGVATVPALCFIARSTVVGRITLAACPRAHQGIQRARNLHAPLSAPRSPVNVAVQLKSSAQAGQLGE